MARPDHTIRLDPTIRSCDTIEFDGTPLFGVLVRAVETTVIHRLGPLGYTADRLAPVPALGAHDRPLFGSRMTYPTPRSVWISRRSPVSIFFRRYDT